jgi:RHS repeat-associated protein
MIVPQHVAASASTPRQSESTVAASPPFVFDDFNRTVTSGWGTSTAGVPWDVQYNAFTNVPTSVDGQSGVIGSEANNEDAFMRVIANSPGIPLPWKDRQFEFTGRFKTGYVDQSSYICFGLYKDDTPKSAGFCAGFGPDRSDLSVGAFGVGQQIDFTWSPNTWYSVKWLFVKYDQTRVKVWPAGTAEPGWTISVRLDLQGSLYTDPSFAISRSGSSSGFWDVMSFDDFTFTDPGPYVEDLPAGTEDNAPYINQDEAGDPVNTLTGSLSSTNLDVAIPGRGPAVEFSRTYNSNDTRVGALGPGWGHLYEIRLVTPGDGSDSLVLVGPQGRRDRYLRSGDDFIAPPGVQRTLTQKPDGTFSAVDRAQTAWLFDSHGILTQIRDRYGNSSNLSYDTYGRLTTVSDAAGRGNVTIGYGTDYAIQRRITSVTDWASPARAVTYEYDASGRLWKVTDREGKTTTYTYDGTSQRLATVTNGRGKVVLTTTYDAQGRVATQRDARGVVTGEATTFDYIVNPDDTRVTTTTAPATSYQPAFQPTIEDSYDANGWLVQRITRPSSTDTLTQSFTYDGAGNQASITDPRGNRTDFCYDVDYAGSSITGSSGNLTRVIGAAPVVGANRPVSLSAYDSVDNLIQTVTPKGVPSGTSVTCSSNLSAINIAYATDFGYDPSGVYLLSKTARFTDPDSGLKTSVTKFEYQDPANPGRVTRVIPPRGNTGPSPDYTYATTSTYYTTGSQAGLLKDVTDALGNKVSYTYDAVGRLATVVDALGNAAGGVPADHTTTFSYDNEDRLRFERLPAPVAGGTQLVTETRYDEVGNPIVRIDAAGQVATYAYDDRNSLFQVKESPLAWTDPTSPPAQVITTEYTRDAGGNPTRITRAKGDTTYERVLDYVYDGRGLPRAETQYPAWPSTAGPLVTIFGYDGAGNQTTVLDPLGRTLTVGYDALNRRSSLDYSDPATPDVSFAYDANGNRTQMTDGTGVTTYVLDEADRPVSVTSPGPNVVGYRYDLDGSRTKLIYPDATVVNYVFNKGGQLVSLTDWASRSVSYTYSPDGQIQGATNPNGSTVAYAYDNARRLLDIRHARSNGQQIDRFYYTLDPLANVLTAANGPLVNQFARPDGLGSSSGTWTGTYASINEVTPNDATFLASPLSPTTSHFYEVTLSDVAPPGTTTGITFRYRYAKSGNNSGKTINLTVELRQGTTVIASQTHANIPGVDGSGWQQGSVTLTAGQAAAITNYADLRLRFRPSSSGGGQGRTAQISWAELQAPGPGTPSSLISYTYDRLSRLTGSTDSAGSRSYSYDPVGNRLSRVDGATTNYTYDRADRLTAAGALVVTVNANGNLTTKGPDTFSYDAADRLVGATVGGTTETYVYDGDGRRFSRQVGANPAIRYVSDAVADLATVLSDGGRKYVYGLGIAYSVSGTAIEIYHTDRLGSVRALTDATGTTIATYRSDDWGRPAGSTGSSSQPFSFTGEPRDGTGLTYLRARYYDPDLGRFMTRDRWLGVPALPQTHDRYAYVANNPVTRTDPSGQILDTALDAAFIVYDLGALLFGPPKDREGNLLALGADVGAAFVPFVTGAGIVARVAAKGDSLLGKLLRISEHIDLKTLEAARDELNGIVVATKSTGVPYQHVQEIQDAQRGLLNVIDQVQNQLADAALHPGSINDATRAQLEEVLSQASQLLDWTEKYIPR